MANVTVPGFRQYWAQKLASLKSVSHVITNKHPEAASVMQQVYKLPSDAENLAESTLAKVGERSEKTYIMNSAVENKATFVKF
jgi:hypothetical protein